MDEVLFFICLAFFGAITGVLMIALIIKGIRNLKRHTLQAEVVTKKKKRVYIEKVAVARVSGMDWFEYYAVFRTEKGKQLELQLSKEIYDEITEGDKGQLTYKGNNFISFDRNSAFFV